MGRSCGGARSAHSGPVCATGPGSARAAAAEHSPAAESAVRVAGSARSRCRAVARPGADRRAERIRRFPASRVRSTESCRALTRLLRDCKLRIERAQIENSAWPPAPPASCALRAAPTSAPAAARARLRSACDKAPRNPGVHAAERLNEPSQRIGNRSARRRRRTAPRRCRAADSEVGNCLRARDLHLRLLLQNASGRQCAHRSCWQELLRSAPAVPAPGRLPPIADRRANPAASPRLAASSAPRIGGRRCDLRPRIVRSHLAAGQQRPWQASMPTRNGLR